MNASTSVEIHEFSTGIRIQGTRDNWVSLGFTGQYMNVTISPIPHDIERSIANKEFAVAEGASSEEPAVIGRVMGSGDSAWSVIAIVTRGRDERGRSASLYRYFLCEGDDSLPKILAWIEKQRQNGQMPIFNPFEKKEEGSPNISYTSTLIFDDDKLTFPPNFSESVPVIISQKKYTSEKELHLLAIEKANGQPIAWAFNVEVLEQLRGFQIIQAASEKAYGILQKAKVNTTQLPVLMVDEQAIKSAIKGLMNSSTAKPEYVEAIANSLGDTQITESYWREIFDSQGADKALKQGLYSDQFVRLLMLRAIVIPETLPEYIVWLEKGSKQNDPYKVAEDFEAQLSKSLKQISATSQNLETNINKGIQILLSSLLSQKVSSKTVNRLLTLDNGLWKKFLPQFIKELDHDLNLMRQFASGEKNLPFRIVDASWHKIWQDLKSYWQNKNFPHLEKYQPLAEVFSNLDNPKISAIFYHVGYGQVPKEIFFQFKSNRWHSRIYGIEVHREVTVPELFWLTIVKLGDKIVPVQTVIPIVLLSLLLGSVGGFISGKSSNLENAAQLPNKHNSANSTQPLNVQQNSNVATSDSESLVSVEKFNSTRIAIQQIIDELKSKDKPQNVIQGKIKNVLQQEKLKFEVITNDSNQLIIDWTKAIEQYEDTKKKNTNSHINESDIENTNNTLISKELKCDVAKSLGIELEKDCSNKSKR